MIMYCSGGRGAVMGREGFGDWWAGGAPLEVVCRERVGRVWATQTTWVGGFCRYGVRGNKPSKLLCGRMAVGSCLMSSFLGNVIVVCKGDASGIVIPRSHKPLIFSLSATLRNVCKESCVMLTWPKYMKSMRAVKSTGRTSCNRSTGC